MRILIKFQPKILLFFLLIVNACQKNQSIQKLEWQALDTNTDHLLWSAHFTNPDTGWACGGLRYTEATLLYTQNGGDTWQKQSLDFGKIIFDIQFLNAQKGFATAYDGKILSTKDGGQNWAIYQMQSGEKPWQALRSLQFVNDTLGFVVGGQGYNSGIVMRTIDGGLSWQNTWFDAELRDVFFTDARTGYISGYGVIFKTLDAGQTWFPLEVSGDFFTALHFPTPLVGYAVGNQGTILKTTTAGHSWNKLRNGNKIGQKNLHFERLFFKNEDIGYLVGRKVVWKTTDGGATFVSLSDLDFENWNSIVITSDTQSFLLGQKGTIVKFEE